MAMVDVAGALALTQRYSKAQAVLLVLSVLSIIAAIWVGAANAWGQG